MPLRRSLRHLMVLLLLCGVLLSGWLVLGERPEAGVVLGVIALGLRRLGFRLRRPRWRRLTMYRSRNPWR